MNLFRFIRILNKCIDYTFGWIVNLKRPFQIIVVAIIRGATLLLILAYWIVKYCIFIKNNKGKRRERVKFSLPFKYHEQENINLVSRNVITRMSVRSLRLKAAKFGHHDYDVRNDYDH